MSTSTENYLIYSSEATDTSYKMSYYGTDDLREEARRVAASLLQDEVEEAQLIELEVRRRLQSEKPKLLSPFSYSDHYDSMDLSTGAPMSISSRTTEFVDRGYSRAITHRGHVLPPPPLPALEYEPTSLALTTADPIDEFRRIAAMEHQMREKLELERRLKEERERRRIEEERRRLEEETLRAAAIERRARERLEAERLQAEYERQKRELEVRQRAEMEARRAEEERLRVEREIRERLEKEFSKEKEIAAKAAEDAKRRADELESKLKTIEIERLQAAEARRKAEQDAENEKKRLDIEREVARRVEEEKRKLRMSTQAQAQALAYAQSLSRSNRTKSSEKDIASTDLSVSVNAVAGNGSATSPIAAAAVNPLLALAAAGADPRQLVDNEIERRVSEVEKRLSQELLEAKELARKAEREAARIAEERKKEAEELMRLQEKMRLDEERAEIEREKARVEEEKRQLAEEKERLEREKQEKLERENAEKKKARDELREQRIAEAVRKKIEEQKQKLVGNMVTSSVSASEETARMQEELQKARERAEQKKKELENLRKVVEQETKRQQEQQQQQSGDGSDKVHEGSDNKNLNFSASFGESKSLGIVDGYVSEVSRSSNGFDVSAVHLEGSREKAIKVPIIASTAKPKATTSTVPKSSRSSSSSSYSKDAKPSSAEFPVRHLNSYSNSNSSNGNMNKSSRGPSPVPFPASLMRAGTPPADTTGLMSAAANGGAGAGAGAATAPVIRQVQFTPVSNSEIVRNNGPVPIKDSTISINSFSADAPVLKQDIEKLQFGMSGNTFNMSSDKRDTTVDDCAGWSTVHIIRDITGVSDATGPSKEEKQSVQFDSETVKVQIDEAIIAPAAGIPIDLTVGNVASNDDVNTLVALKSKYIKNNNSNEDGNQDEDEDDAEGEFDFIEAAGITVKTDIISPLQSPLSISPLSPTLQGDERCDNIGITDRKQSAVSSDRNGSGEASPVQIEEMKGLSLNQLLANPPSSSSSVAHETNTDIHKGSSEVQERMSVHQHQEQLLQQLQQWQQGKRLSQDDHEEHQPEEMIANEGKLSRPDSQNTLDNFDLEVDLVELKSSE